MDTSEESSLEGVNYCTLFYKLSDFHELFFFLAYLDFVQFLESWELWTERSDSTSCVRQILKSSPFFFHADESDHSSPSHCQVTLQHIEFLTSLEHLISTVAHPPSLSTDFQSLRREEKWVAKNCVSHSCSLDIFSLRQFDGRWRRRRESLVI